jgi:hypothetical protein
MAVSFEITWTVRGIFHKYTMTLVQLNKLVSELEKKKAIT